MDTKFIPADHEKKLYDFWEKNGYFEAKVDSSKEPFCAILPPPNANGNLHIGHGRYVYADIMARFAKLQGKEVFWLPGADHAGFETQYTYEKYLQKQGKSRFDFKRDELYQNIWDFVKTNQQNMEDQLRAFGFSLDWGKKKFTLDPDIVAIVYKTFKKMFDEGLIYRANRLVNYCTKNGTAFSDLEVESVEVAGTLYEIAYKLADGSGEVIVATTRPETLFGDQAVMVHPKDVRYKKLIGKSVLLPISNREIPIIADDAVDSAFGTGVVKVTPAHDHTDAEVGKRHNLAELQIIGFDGKMMNTNFCDGLKVLPAREKVLEQLSQDGLLRGQKEYATVKKTCYKCGSTLEPLPLPQWYVKVAPLTKHAIAAIKKKDVTIFPKRFTPLATRWLENAIDWNISRQIVWGIQIPAWKCEDCGEWTVTDGSTPEKCTHCAKNTLVQDTDTFDTWFSSGQWPFATLQSLEKDFPGFFKYFYPTSVMETAYEILYFWVCRMIMLGIYVTGEVPFKSVFLHGLVRDAKGQKMSKSKGNVINPMEYIDKYGADSLRAALIFGSAEGNDIPVSEDKVRAMRNFANKVWNIGRFIGMMKDADRDSSRPMGDQNDMSMSQNNTTPGVVDVDKLLTELEKEFVILQKQTIKDMEAYKFSQAFNNLYEFLWHRFADYYIEQLKSEAQSGNIDVVKKLEEVYLATLVLLHPFIPFVTEAVYKVFKGEQMSILDSKQLQN